MLISNTVIPIHRLNESSEMVIVCRGKVREEFYDAHGVKVAEFVLEAKDRPYDPVGTRERDKSDNVKVQNYL